jgi:hypothetical protein
MRATILLLGVVSRNSIASAKTAPDWGVAIMGIDFGEFGKLLAQGMLLFL